MAAAQNKYDAAVAQVQAAEGEHLAAEGEHLAAEGEHLAAVGINTGGAHEARVTPLPNADRTAGSNVGSAANVFENRVSQHI
jgi:hypothetical protein